MVYTLQLPYPYFTRWYSNSILLLRWPSFQQECLSFHLILYFTLLQLRGVQYMQCLHSLDFIWSQRIKLDFLFSCCHECVLWVYEKYLLCSNSWLRHAADVKQLLQTLMLFKFSWYNSKFDGTKALMWKLAYMCVKCNGLHEWSQ